MRSNPLGIFIWMLFAFTPGAAMAEQLYSGGDWPAMASDQRASQVGDILTVVIYESARASNKVQNRTSKSTSIGGSISGGGLAESGSLNFGGDYAGGGEVMRSDQFFTQMTVQIIDVYPNGDYQIQGQQAMRINGEKRDVIVKGRIRRADILGDNRIVSSRIADAQINYDGKGFVSRSAKPGIINRILGFLGIL